MNSFSQSRSVVILGATGSVGVATSQRDHERLLAQCRVHQPQYAFLSDERAASILRDKVRDLGLATEVLTGDAQLLALVSDPEVAIVMSAIVGCAGLKPTLAAAQAGKRLLLANKESLVVAGELLIRVAAESGAVILPIDSEHNAIYQAAPAGLPCGAEAGDFLKRSGVRRLFLMASGGPFRTAPAAELERVTPQQALRHPVWRMGPKISIDCATMMNKGLELIEACWLFDVAPDDVKIVVHPEAVIHGMVEYVDGSVIAHMASADMRIPIAYGLHWPNRVASGVEPLDIFTLDGLSFAESDAQKFPCLRLARQAMVAGGIAPATLNAANEEAVAAFLAEQIAFTAIPTLVEAALDCADWREASSVEAVLAADAAARRVVQDRIAAYAV
ncbi:MAG: 1-deoxy-D-xylulose-5-phosphate reductoisomerase [Gammaproteobacteria bacterium]